jgi:hypothetical protein
MIPPLTRRFCPVIHRASSLTKSATHVSDVLGLPQPSERGKLGKPLHVLLRLAFPEELGVGRAWRNHIDGDASWSQFLGQNVRKLLDGPFVAT